MTFEMNDNGDEYDPQPGPEGRNGPSLFLIFSIILVALAAAFFFQNGESAPIEFLWLDRSVPIWLVVLISIGVGMVLNRLLISWWRRARKKD